MRGFGLAAAVTAAALGIPTLAAAAAPLYCAARSDVLTRLAGEYREQPASVALTSDGQLLEVLKSDTKMTWSILITSPNGMSCLVAAGESWQDKEIDAAALAPQT